MGEVKIAGGHVVHRRLSEEGTKEAVAFAKEVWDDYSPDENS